MVRVEQVLGSWRAVRDDTIAAVEEFPVSDFDFQPAPGVDSFRGIARHILNAGDGFIGMLLEGIEDFTTPDFPERYQRHTRKLPADAGPAELAAALRQSIEQCTAALAAQTPDFFSQVVTRFPGEKMTRLELIQSIKEHELTHRAQLFMILRLKGIVPPTTRRRLARQAGR